MIYEAKMKVQMQKLKMIRPVSLVGQLKLVKLIQQSFQLPMLYDAYLGLKVKN